MNTKASLSALLFVALIHFSCACAAPPSELLHVVTWNIAHGRGLAESQIGIAKEVFEGNLDAVAAVLRRENPDVIALQEADAPSAWSGSFDHVKRLAEAADYPHTHHGLHLRSGVGPLRIQYGTALLARRPLDSPNSHPFAANRWHVKGFVTAEIEFAGKRVLVTSLHLDSPSKTLRVKQVEELIAALREAKMPLIVMGDFNSGWKDESDALRVTAAKLDLQADQPQAADMATFRADHPKKRIDWILLSRTLEFVDYRVWPDLASDHLAVAAKVRWNKCPK